MSGNRHPMDVQSCHDEAKGRSLAGMSRSVTVVVAYIMSVTHLSWKEALKVVRAGRAIANPNLGFQKQLEEFECTRLLEERRRLKERYPSLALIYKDQEQCALMLNNYEELLQSRTICEGRCALGEQCPTGLCRSSSTQKRTRTRSSSRSKSEIRRSPSCSSTSSENSACNVRPRSGPAGLRSYTVLNYCSVFVEKMECEHVIGDTDRGTRKRRKNMTSKERKKQIRYSDHDSNLDNFTYPCKHESCNNISLEELRACRAKFYKDPNKIKQDTKISHLLEVYTPKRQRSRKLHNEKHHRVEWKTVYDFKEALNSLKKVVGISEAKRILIKRTKNGGVVMKTEQYYRNDDESKKYETLLKKGKQIGSIKLSEVPLTRGIKKKKIKSLTKLLIELATENWRSDAELAWLAPILPGNIENLPDEEDENNEDDVEQEELCSAPPSRSGSRVDVSSLGISGTLTAPTTPQGSPPVSPIRRGTTSGRISIPLALKEDDFDL
ncbi:hypothetical protein NQ314_010556 [Rhamnusium bicolor]|uniref:Dual specificity phosphatase catalytic domain-containing protein n=1 Tax=Rhamnusium bicolor TaxID=1586634 RepID=A0AAV8XPX6_9CUCU|nr:hypothetical protein NQ314_010556 [Rhamnusium bicolor]